jgi:hypothetical protein
MRFLRMLTNAVLAGGLGAAFVGVLILQLNPHLPLSASVLLALGQRLWVFYGINLAVFFYALIVFAQLLSRERLSPGWLSLRLLAWSSTLVTGGAAALMWLNVRGFGVVLEAEAARRMAAGAAATSVCAFLLLTIAVVHYSFGRRGSRVGGTLFALTILAALVLPLAARGWGRAPAPAARGVLAVPLVPDATVGSVSVLMVDGGSLDFVSPITAAGRLPHFARLLEEGAAMHLATLRPTQPGPVWAAVMTGVYPPRNGVRATERYAFGAGGHEVTLLPDLCLAHALVTLRILGVAPQDSRAFEARPLWSILGAAGVSVGLTGVPLTHPAPRVQGYVVSDRLHLLSSATLPYGERDLVHPEDLLAHLPDDALELPARAAGGSPGQGALPRDVFYRELARRLDARIAPRVRVLRYEGVDVAGHHYLRYAMPGAFGDVSPQERQHLGQVLEQQYAWLDAEIGAAMDALGPDDLLLVVSGFGMEPQSPGKRLLSRVLREPDLPGTHERAPDGFLLAWGRSVAPGRLPVGAIVDVAPTVLYFLGLPVARDMDGYARTDIFTRAFTAERPVTYIPTYGR